MRAIINATVISQGRFLTDHALIFDQQIRALCPVALLPQWPVEEVIDAAGFWLAPGLIDIHVHGCGGYDTMDASEQSLSAMSYCLAQHGVTSFLPTTMASELSHLHEAIKIIRRLAPARGWATRSTENKATVTGARVLGVNLEGPFLNPKYKGAHAAEHLRAPSFELITEYLDIIRIITFAPELPGGKDLLTSLAVYPQVVPAIGHSSAEWEEVQNAIKLGLRHVTHLFNAMPSLHHRQPGVVGAVLSSNLSVELIADDLHVHPGLYRLLLKTHGQGELILVSDGMRAAGLGDGEYNLGGQKVLVEAGAARLDDGTLAGSAITLERAIANFQRATGCGMTVALSLATRNPARLLGLDDMIGDLRVGMQADMIVIDGNFNVQQTFIGGRSVAIANRISYKSQ